MTMPSSCSQDWKFFAFRSMDDVKKTNDRILVLDQNINQKMDSLRQKINQRIDATDRNINEKNMNPEKFVTLELLSQLIGKHQQDIIRLGEELADQQRQIRILLDRIHQLEEALEEARHAYVKQEVRIDQIKAVTEVDHATLFDLAGDIAQVKIGGTSELSRVNTKIAMKAGKKEVERQLKALRAEGTQCSATEEPRRDTRTRSPTASVPTARDLPEDALERPIPRRNRMPLKRKAGYEFKTTDERSGGRFLDY